jgi:hypothetical protein
MRHAEADNLAHRIARFPAAGAEAVKDRVNAIARVRQTWTRHL